MDNRTARTQEFASRIERGLIPAVPIPFDREGRIHEAAQECHIRYLATQPVAGVAVWVHTGRGLHLTRELRKKVLAAWRTGLPSNMVVVAGAGAPPALAADYDAYVRAALEMAEDAAEGGADALLVHPPRVADVAGFHRLIAGAGVPLLLFYLFEAAGGVSYSPELLRELLSLEVTAGIKMATLDSVMRYQEVSRLLEEFPARLLVTGEDRFFGYSFMRGARAALVGMGAACCRFLHSMMKAWFDFGKRAGAGEEFLKRSRQVDELAEAIFVAPMEGYIQRMLLVLSEQGVIPEGGTFDPWGPTLDRVVERNRIGAALHKLGLERP